MQQSPITTAGLYGVTKGVPKVEGGTHPTLLFIRRHHGRLHVAEWGGGESLIE